MSNLRAHSPLRLRLPPRRPRKLSSRSQRPKDKTDLRVRMMESTRPPLTPDKPNVVAVAVAEATGLAATPNVAAEEAVAEAKAEAAVAVAMAKAEEEAATVAVAVTAP